MFIDESFELSLECDIWYVLVCRKRTLVHIRKITVETSSINDMGRISIGGCMNLHMILEQYFASPQICNEIFRPHVI